MLLYIEFYTVRCSHIFTLTKVIIHWFWIKKYIVSDNWFFYNVTWLNLLKFVPFIVQYYYYENCHNLKIQISFILKRWRKNFFSSHKLFLLAILLLKLITYFELVNLSSLYTSLAFLFACILTFGDYFLNNKHFKFYTYSLL